WGWIFCALVAVYLLGKVVWWLVQRVRRARYAGAADADRNSDAHREQPRTAYRLSLAAAFSPAPRTRMPAPASPCRLTASGAPIAFPSSRAARSGSPT